MDIINHKHKFSIGGKEVELLINCKDGAWLAEVIKGETGVGTCSGGTSKTLEEYIEKIEREHRYVFSFFSQGYKAAKESILHH